MAGIVKVFVHISVCTYLTTVVFCIEKQGPAMRWGIGKTDTGVQSISTASPQPRQRLAPRKRASPQLGQ
jgi:hypothetical protein